MTIKLSVAQSLLLHSLVKIGPQYMSRNHITSRWLVTEGYAQWTSKLRLEATEKGIKFVKGEL